MLLCMDSAGCHPDDIKDKYSNIKVAFFSPNTTLKLGLGVIQNFKGHYRRLVLRFVLVSIDSCSSASQVAGSINIAI